MVAMPPVPSREPLPPAAAKIGRRDRTDVGNEARLRVFARRRVVQAVDVGQEDEKTGLYETGDNGGQCVVVAEFDFFGGDGVVFVDNGNGAESEQALKGVHGVLFALWLLGEAEFAGAAPPAPVSLTR